MKIFWGIIIALICLATTVLTILALWGIQPISWIIFIKALITIAIIALAMLILRLIQRLFFHKNTFNKNKGNKAHPID